MAFSPKRSEQLERRRQCTFRRILRVFRKPGSRASRSLSLLFVFAMMVGAELYAQNPTESEVKAVYLYNFAKYVRWPPHAAGTFEICILGTDPFGTALDQIARDEKVNSEPLAIRRVRSASDTFTCRIVFLGSSESKHLDQDLTLLAGHPILTVSDIGNFATQGGEIQFVNDDGRVRFVINRRAAEKCGLAFSSELLKVAKLVLPDAPAGRE